MELKQCPKCKRYSVSLDFNRGVEICRWRDCNWVNVAGQDLPIAYKTDITSRANHAFKDESIGAEQRLPA